MSTSSPPRSVSVRTTITEQYAPVLRVHADLLGDCTPSVDAAAARERIARGQVAYDALRVLRSCGDLTTRFVRVLDAFEIAGLVSNAERRAIMTFDLDVDDLVAGWYTGDRTPRDSRRRVARQVAIVVANALLRAATSRVGLAPTWQSWNRTVCPCCGGAPDIALVERLSARARQRTLVSGHCDAHWRVARAGCLGCDASESPLTIARISNPELGYDLMICNSCGRFLKERPRKGIASLIVERALTAELDIAAELRGLRS